MKNFVVAVFTLISLSCLAQNENSVLWRISGNGLKEPSYLMGTMHIVPAKQFVINDSMMSCFKKSKSLIIEANIKATIGEQMKIVQRGMLPKGKSLKNYLDSTTFTQYYTYWSDSMKVNKNQLNKMLNFKPIFLNSYLYTQFIKQPKSYELEFLNLAKNKKKLRTLETLLEQMSMLDSIPFADQLSEYKIDKKYNELLNLYIQQDTYQVNHLIKKCSPRFESILITKRNENWIPKINDAIKEEPCFIAVGLAHIIGENGIINLLRKQGYTLEPIHQSLIKK